MKTGLLISDTAYENLTKQAFDLGYVRNIWEDMRPRGLSTYVAVIGNCAWYDARPDWVRGSGQWHPANEPLRERCLRVFPETVAAIGRIALQPELQIMPYKSQLPVINGWRRDASPPWFWPLGQAPKGATSIRALVAPVLEAIGQGWLLPVDPVPPAPPGTFVTPVHKILAMASRRRAVQTSQSW